FSCPQMRESGMGSDVGQDLELVTFFTAYVKRSVGIPVIPKMTPNADFYRFLNGQPYRGTFYLLDEDRDLLLSLSGDESGTSINSVRRLAARSEQDGYKAAEEKTIISISYTSNERLRAYTVAMPVLRDGEAEGYLAYRFYEQGLIEFLNAGRSPGLFVLADRNGGIVAANLDAAEDALDRFLPQISGEYNCTIGDEDFYIARQTVAGTTLELYTLSRQIFFINGGTLLMTAVILGLLVLSYLVYSQSLAKRMTEPVDELLEAIQQLKTGDFAPTESLTNLEEFRQLFDEYNGAIEQLDKLMETQQSLKIRQLEAQFNPHFLYNVLETLKYTIATDTEAAQDIVLRLSHLMRYAAKPAEQEVALGDDMVYIEDYLALQKQRFLDRLSYTLNVSEDARDAKIFRLLLQPLVENSIKYGYVAKQRIHVDVDCRTEGSDLLMAVTDDGGGMTDARLAAVQKALDEGVNPGESLGLFNTHQMIRLKYGAPYGLSFENRPGEGLTVKVRMPY
ncbi:MAG: histidine kinase, partial [Firmicutes bacterium]|nr:histidine kinase [Bacillota bacterium]